MQKSRAVRSLRTLNINRPGMRSLHANSFVAAIVLAICADAARPKLPELKSSKSAKEDGKARDFTIKGKGRSSDATEFEFVPDKCMLQAASQAVRLDSKPPYYEDISLKECARVGAGVDFELLSNSHC